jgi:hypothetical protein
MIIDEAIFSEVTGTLKLTQAEKDLVYLALLMRKEVV